MKLTDKAVAVLALDGKKDAIHFDDSLTGFGYRLRAVDRHLPHLF